MPITPDELLEMPDDPVRREIHDGVLVERSLLDMITLELNAHVSYEILNHVHEHKLGRVAGANGGFILSESPYNVLSPMVSFISRAKAKPYTNKLFDIAPDLAVEINYAEESAETLQWRVQKYLQSGSQLVWVIYSPPLKQVEIYRHGTMKPVTLVQEDTLEGEDVLPGFKLSISELFAVLDDE